MEYEYKVIDVADGGVSTVLVGDGRIETAVLQAYLNAMAADGWRMVFMEEVLQRYMLTSDRETLMVTFERRVPEGQRQDCAARYNQAGRQKAVKLAAFGDASFAQIKLKAEKLRSEVVMGGDPAGAKAEPRRFRSTPSWPPCTWPTPSCTSEATPQQRVTCASTWSRAGAESA